jgi:hypothetical protein
VDVVPFWVTSNRKSTAAVAPMTPSGGANSDTRALRAEALTEEASSNLVPVRTSMWVAAERAARGVKSSKDPMKSCRG